MRQRRTVTGLSEERLVYFIYDSSDLEPGLDGFDPNFTSEQEVKDCYLEHREQILAEYIKLSPCRRPDMWWTERNMTRPAHAEDDYLDRIVEAETLDGMGELTPVEIPKLEELRTFYAIAGV